MNKKNKDQIEKKTINHKQDRMIKLKTNKTFTKRQRKKIINQKNKS